MFNNALTAVGALMTLLDFTLPNARRFYSSMGSPSAVKGIKDLLHGIRNIRKNDPGTESLSPSAVKGIKDLLHGIRNIRKNDPGTESQH